MRNGETALRLSPIHDALQSLQGTWREVNRMPVLVSVSTPVTAAETLVTNSVAIADLSCLNRFGVKGSGAAEWLAQQGLPIPTHPNTWCPLSNNGIIARLGITEFLIEDEAFHLVKALQDPPPQVYPVLRQDLAIALSGSAIHDLLLQTCSFNFRALSLANHPVVLTSMIGVSVTVLPGDRDGIPFYRIWCDGTFGVYFWETLLAIAQELGGGAMGVETLFGVH